MSGQPKQFMIMYLQFGETKLLSMTGTVFPNGKVINRATIIGMSPMNINSFLSSIFFDNGPTNPKQIVAIQDPMALKVPRYLTVSSLVHPHISIANGDATLEFEVQM